MRKHILCIVLVVVSSAASLAQLNTDSLLAIAANLSDEAKRSSAIKEWIKLYPPAKLTNPIDLYKAQLTLGKSTKNFEQELSAGLDLISLYGTLGNFAGADSLALAYAPRAMSSDVQLDRIRILHEAAKSAYYAQDYATSILNDSIALKQLSLLSDAATQDSIGVHIRYYLGKCFTASGQLVLAATTLSDAIELQRTIRVDTNLLTELYTELGIVFSQIGLYDKAVEYLDRSTIYGDNLPAVDQAGKAINIGRNLLLSRKFTSARERYLLALTFELNETQQILYYPYIYNGLVESAYRLGNLDSLNWYYQIFSDVLAASPDQAHVNGFLYKQSTWLHHLANGKLSKAKIIGESLLRDARKTGDPADLLFYTELLADTYRRAKNYQAADELSSELIARKDSIHSANRNNALLLYYNQFETQEKENEILRLDAERSREAANRTLFQTIAGLLTLLMLAGLFFFLKLRSARIELSEKNTQLNQLIATKDRFFGIIAHDLRSPVAALSTADEQIEYYLQKDNLQKVSRVARLLGKSTRHLSKLLDNLLNWAMSQQGLVPYHPENIKLSNIIEDVYQLYTPSATAKEISLTTSVSEELNVFADKSGVAAMLRNLVSNAIKFTPRKGHVTIAANAQQSKIEITVTDDGKGMTDSKLKQLFNVTTPSSQGTEGEKGTGLGLVLVKELVTLNKGSVTAVAGKQKGTIFTLTLPAVPF